MEEWRLIPFDRFSAFENMATDEAILQEGQRRRIPPTLRFYGWIRPAVSIGYFQDLRREINCDFCRKGGIDIVRRPTGGKAVFHDGDLTYSFVAHELNPPFSSGIVENYGTISRCIAAGLKRAGIEAAMVEEGRGSHSGSLDSFCFSVPLRNELLVGDKKICGSAQLRSRSTFLQHGSILLDFDPEMTARVMRKNEENLEGEISKLKSLVTCVNEHCKNRIGADILRGYIRESFEETMNVRVVESILTPREEVLKERFLRDKYLKPEWNMEGKVQIYGRDAYR
ncbi:MAG: biotin/lipoate A/B protein ligase family protein [Thermodesulfobacteriota bacterium]|nr:biotin/lipoate A/B protein ligase family protein [Thermodesulfobacteriota bacterium]